MQWFVSWIIETIMSIFSTVLNAIFGLFGSFDIPIIDNFSSILSQFWDIVFSGVGFIRSAFLIGHFEMNIIITILTIRLLYKPAISILKMFIGWFNKLKL